ncbi:uncharacterized domain 1-containing protein [Rhizobiales bacterium GAS191]|nr:uncharacterized domain 1-containing protein [Rhizobiales bacterium GAS191]
MTTALQTERSRTISWSDPKATARAGMQLSGLAYLEAIRAGDLAPPPAVACLDVLLGDVEEGRVSMRLLPAEHHYNTLGSVHGGVIATLLDSVMGCAVHSTLPPGQAYTTLEIKVNYVRAVTDATGEVTAEGRLVHGGRRSAVAEATLTDAAGRLYATASTTCLVLEPAAGRQER